MKKISQPRKTRREEAQSFVEVALFLPILLIMLSGLVEFGFLMNQYLNLLDGPREGARWGASHYPTEAIFYTGIENEAASIAINPVSLNPATDDVIISTYTYRCIPSCVTSLYGTTHSWAQDMHSTGPNATSAFTATTINAKVGTGANTKGGVLVVELFYSYHQILGLPWITVFVPDPIRVSSYTIMPLPAIEPAS
jgi:hypothetical protein